MFNGAWGWGVSGRHVSLTFSNLRFQLVTLSWTFQPRPKLPHFSYPSGMWHTDKKKMRSILPKIKIMTAHWHWTHSLESQGLTSLAGGDMLITVNSTEILATLFSPLLVSYILPSGKCKNFVCDQKFNALNIWEIWRDEAENDKILTNFLSLLYLNKCCLSDNL